MTIAFPLGAGAAWLSTHSIPDTIVAANGIIGTNLKWLGWDHPPKALASTAADHTVLGAGLALTIVGFFAILSWLIEWAIKRTTNAQALADMTAYEVAHYLADESDWGRRLRLFREPFEHLGQFALMRKEPLIEAPIEISKRASQSGTLIRAYGRRSDSPVAEPIPHTFWISNGVSPFATDNPGISLTAPMAGNHDAAPVIYRDLRFERAGIVGTWPRMAWWRRVAALLRLQKRTTTRISASPSAEPAETSDTPITTAQDEADPTPSDASVADALKAWARKMYGGGMNEQAFDAAWDKLRRRAAREALSHVQGISDLWRGTDPLHLYQAACLWVETSPPNDPDDPLPHEASPWLHMLKKAIIDGKLPLFDDDNRIKFRLMVEGPKALREFSGTPVKIPNDVEVSRADLKAFADSIGERPEFLLEDNE
ncbi:MAG: hypothetical protein JWO81_201 [Alphaproteobacteria bacterium]|nr:hypothetical protein [Alphaproteobacteria bacterium]